MSGSKSLTFFFLWSVEKKNTVNGNEACQGKFVYIVEGFTRFSLAKRLESLPVSRLVNCDLR